MTHDVIRGSCDARRYAWVVVSGVSGLLALSRRVTEGAGADPANGSWRPYEWLIRCYN